MEARAKHEVLFTEFLAIEEYVVKPNFGEVT
jgi:hypothetical protein